ncbi:hypothetical protein D3C71_1717580 [compost metagenome]
MDQHRIRKWNGRAGNALAAAQRIAEAAHGRLHGRHQHRGQASVLPPFAHPVASPQQKPHRLVTQAAQIGTVLHRQQPRKVRCAVRAPQLMPCSMDKSDEVQREFARVCRLIDMCKGLPHQRACLVQKDAP